MPKINKYLPVFARVLMGLIFFVIGLNGIYFFIPPPSDLPEKVVVFNVALLNTGYLYQLVVGTEILVGFLLIVNRFVPLALALIAPVIVNIVAFHLFIFPEGISPAIVVLVLEIYLAWVYREVFKPMLAMRRNINQNH